MFESIYAPSTAPTERLLARLTDPTRAAAIMGDLAELSATRGRLWFWTAYTRTLASLGWRTPVAFLFAIASIELILRTVSTLVHLMPDHLGDGSLFGELGVRHRLVLWNLPLGSANCLAFVLPFVLIRFGLRNRLTQLACALLLISIPVFAPLSWVRDLCGVLTALAITAALVFPPWRRPVIVLAGTCFTGVVAMVVCAYTLAAILHQRVFMLSHPAQAICNLIGLATAATVCLRLHHHLLEPYTPADSTLA